MSVHHGSIVERAVRRKQVNISEISRRMNVNRRSIYNWFQQDYLKIEIICEIGYIIDYDFSQDLPHEFAQDGYPITEKPLFEGKYHVGEQTDSLHFWMNKYIDLLEKYNELLLNHPKEINMKKVIKFSDLKYNSPMI